MERTVSGGIYRLSLGTPEDGTITVVVLSGDAFNRRGATVWAAPVVGREEANRSRAVMRIVARKTEGWVALDALRTLDLVARGAVLVDRADGAWVAEARLRLIQLLSSE